jgi:phage terminase Nu1 subunit (DNA packaging protein)
MLRIDDLKEVSRAILARLFRCSGPAINAMVQRGMPRLKSGRYNLFDVVAWRFDELALSNGKAETKEAQRWLTRFRKSRALRDELAGKREAGELIPANEVRNTARTVIGEINSALDNFSVRLSGQVVGLTDRNSAERTIELEVHVLRTILARGQEYSDAAVKNVIAEIGGLSPKQARDERSRRERTMPRYMKFDPRRKVFTDDRDGTVVPEAEAEGYVRTHAYTEAERAEYRARHAGDRSGGSDGGNRHES